MNIRILNLPFSLLMGLLTISFTWTLITPNAAAFSMKDDEMGFQTALIGQATLGDGSVIDINFPLAFEENNNIWYFRAGQQKVAMYLPPSQYNLLFAVHEADAMVHIAEFSHRYLKSFLVQIDQHEIELIPTPGTPYHLLLRVDDRYMRFDKRTPTISLQIDGFGLTGFKFEGFLRDLSNRRID